jgi:hypothetical protein
MTIIGAGQQIGYPYDSYNYPYTSQFYGGWYNEPSYEFNTPYTNHYNIFDPYGNYYGPSYYNYRDDKYGYSRGGTTYYGYSNYNPYTWWSNRW